MSKISRYFRQVLAKKDDNKGDSIEAKLSDKNKKEKPQDVIVEKQLDKDRKETDDITTEKRLDDSRTGSKDVLIEGQLSRNNSNLVAHRNPNAAKGNINKLEEKRVKGYNIEKEKQEPASEVDKPRRFWENSSPDGLKLASKRGFKKVAELEDFDIILEDTLSEDEKLERLEKQFGEDPDKFLGLPSGFQEELSPEALKELEQFEIEDDSSPEEIEAMSLDLMGDPDFLNDIFSEEVVGTNNDTGTLVEERKITFDLRDDDGNLIDVFKRGKSSINRDKVKKALINFININHVNEIVDEDSMHVDVDVSNLTGFATYFVPKA